MININEDNLREYFKPVLDVFYVIGEGFNRTPVTTFSQMDALAKLYYTNESMLVEGKSPYLRLGVDDDGIKYAEITKEFIALAKIAGYFNPAKNSLTPLSTRVKLSEARNVADENLFEETIDDKINTDMYERVTGYAGVKEISSKDAFFKEYGMIFLPPNNTLQNKNLIIDNKGILVDAYNAEPIVKIREFRLFSN